jgi:hypothetical protein
LRRDVRVRGVEPQMLAAPTQGTDASQNIDKQLDMIAGASGIPKRILVGSERGELSSEQDENNWAARVAERRTIFAGPMIVRPFVQRMIEIGVLEEPEGGEFEVIWSESDALGEEKRATIAKTKAEAVSTYANSPGASLVIPTEEFRRWLGEDEESEFMPEELDVVDGPPGSAPLPEEDDQVVVQFDQHRQARRGDPPAAKGDGAPAVPIVNATPRPLYVRRQVKNWRALERWAKEQGLKSTLGEAMHVTIAYSRSPVDWIKAGQAFDSDAAGEMSVAPGGPRVVEALGPNGAVVLHFASSSLAWRHEDIKRAGASWDYPTYQPHVTLTYDVGDLNVEELEPYRGGLELGPEIFEELDDNFAEHIIEYSVNAQRQAEERRTNTLRELATTVATSVSDAVRETIVPLIRERDRPRRIKKTAVRNAAGFIDHVIEEESDQ